jgi:hypothetical protein
MELRLKDDVKTYKKIELALKKSKELDQTANMDLAAQNFSLIDCANEHWNPENFSLLHGTAIWDQSTLAQRIKLNQLYWIAYYSQIISAEIATIFYNQTSAAALYGLQDFRIVCDTLDLESAQERAHINVFQKISEQFELEVFGERIFSFPMRGPFVKTMLFSDMNPFQEYWRKWQLKFYSLLSSGNAFIGCQYFMVRGLRTLNGKIVQHQLSKYYSNHPDKDHSPIPSKVSYYHFIDESFHFNTSTVVSHDVLKSIAKPTAFESRIANMTLFGCQRDHFNFSTAINGIFWYDPALYPKIYKVLRSPVFGMEHQEALQAMEKSFCEESQGANQSFDTHKQSRESYKFYLSDIEYVSKKNKEMSLMSQNTLERHLKVNRNELKKFANGFNGKRDI